MSYLAVVVRVVVRPHPNADRLQLGIVLGNQVVVGMDTKDGDLGIFFPTDGQLSEAMCSANDLVSRRDPISGKHLGGGFFCEKRRVRAQKFRKEKSDGWFCSLKYLEWTGYDLTKLKEGDTFTQLNNKEICNKYYTAATLRAMKRGEATTRNATKYFRRHIETGQFRFVAGHIPTGSLIYIDEKLHGTSGRYGHVIDTKKLGVTKRFLNNVWFTIKYKIFRRDLINASGLFKAKEFFTYLNGSRNLILNAPNPNRDENSNKYRHDVVASIALRKGEVLYYEIVGFDSGGTPIMNPQPIKDKDVAKEFGTTNMLYKYGCPEGTFKMYVYRITQVNDDGEQIELPRYQMEARCKELGLQTTPRLHGPIVYDGNQETLRTKVEELTEGKSILDPSHIREGVVLRVEMPDGRTEFYKNKSFLFGVLEGYIKENENHVDVEEAA